MARVRPPDPPGRSREAQPPGTEAARPALAGTRIRALRLARRLAQADLARAAGVSASYLNLIEHNRRRAAAPVLAAIAAALHVPAETLNEEAGDRLIEALRASAAQTGAALGAGTGADTMPPGRGLSGEIDPELDRAEEFAGRFPGWAALTAGLGARVESQDRVIERLSDRMAHDPNLSAALHEIVSAVTAVQSSAAILVETGDIDPEWRARFHANIHADSQRLSVAAEALVAYLDTSAEETGLAAPQEELESWLARQDFHVAALESADLPDLAALTEGQPDLASQAARQMARDWLVQAHRDARALPLDRLVPVLSRMCAARAFAPEGLAQVFDVPLPVVFRRLAGLPPVPGVARFGLVVCDGSGTLTFRRPVEGFALPRFGGGCPVWPLYQAMMQPMRPLRCLVETTTRPVARFVVHALAGPVSGMQFELPQVWQSMMLLSPPGLSAAADAGAAGGDGAAMAVLRVGSSCRVCPRAECPSRREPSIVAG